MVLTGENILPTLLIAGPHLVNLHHIKIGVKNNDLTTPATCETFVSQPALPTLWKALALNYKNYLNNVVQ